MFDVRSAVTAIGVARVSVVADAFTGHSCRKIRAFHETTQNAKLSETPRRTCCERGLVLIPLDRRPGKVLPNVAHEFTRRSVTPSPPFIMITDHLTNLTTIVKRYLQCALNPPY